MKGTVHIQNPGSSKWLELKAKDKIAIGAKIKTGSKRQADVVLTKKGAIRMKSNTEIEVQANMVSEGKQKIDVFMKRGRLLHRFAKNRDYELDYTLKTDVAAAAVRGTEFDVKLKKGSGRFRVKSGKVLVTNEQGSTEVSKDNGTTVEEGKAPSDPSQLSSEDFKELKECGLVRFSVALNKTKRVVTHVEFKNLARALDIYRLQHGKYPKTLAEADLSHFKDPYKHHYKYDQTKNGVSFTLKSWGKDGIPSSDDQEYVHKQ
ncbi:MAG: FecR domain-containing protein [Candidatus Lindowbacteria bacterium]|nr:FecR domain-containing protein [Candidatus Lindowbacteria bacterium]